MGYGLKVLVSLKAYDMEEYNIHQIHDDLVNSILYNILGEDAVEYFSCLNDEELHDSYLGKEKPEEIKQEAKNWKKPVKNACFRAAENIQAYADKEGVSLIELLKDPEKIPWEIRSALRNSLTNTDDIFTYGTSQLFIDYESQPYIGWCDADDVCEHPENYALVHVIYH